MTDEQKQIIVLFFIAIAGIYWVIYFGGKADEMAENCKPNHELKICEFNK